MLDEVDIKALSTIKFDPVLNVDIVVLIMASLLLFLTMFAGKRRVLDRWESFIFILIFVLYLIYLFYRG